jgi:FkbM family methyltransferase
MSLRSTFSRNVRNLLRKTGRDIIHSHDVYIPGLHRRQLMETLGINLVLDVGANLGQTGVALRTDGYSGRIVSFEPLSGPFKELSQRAAEYGNWQVRNCALGESAAKTTINVSGTAWSSSFLPMNSRHTSIVPESAYVGTEEVTISRLDDLFKEYTSPDDKIFMKVDTQGYEMSVLRGLPENLGRIDLIQLELCFVTLYDGQPKYYEPMQFMDEHGFDLVGIWPDFLDEKTKRYLVGDGLFARRAG